MISGVLLAILASAAYGCSTLAQAVGARRADGLGAFRQPLVIAALLVDGLAFLVSLAAYAQAPLFLVQTIIAGAVVIAVLGAPIVLRIRLRKTDVVGAVIVVASLAVVAAGAGRESPVRPEGAFSAILIAVAAACVVLFVAIYRRGPAWTVAAVSGIGFSLAAIGARAATSTGSLWSTLFQPMTLVIVLGGVVGAAANLRALQRGSVAMVAATVSVLEVVLPSVIGVMLLGDSVRPGWTVQVVVAVLAALGGCVVLATGPAGRATAG